MLCTKCGAQIADEAKFCPICGQKTAQAAPAEAPQQYAQQTPTATPLYQQQYAQPVQQPTYANTYTAPAQKLPRKQYFFKAAPQNLKIMNLVSLALGILCVLLIFIPTYRAFNAPIFDYPLMGLIPEAKQIESEYKEILEELKEAEEDNNLKAAFQKEFGLASKELERKHGITLEEFIDLFNNLSINNFVKLTEIIDPNSDIAPIFSVVKGITYAICVILMIITALGTAFQKTWVMVLAYVLSFGFIAMNGGFIFWSLATVAFITTAVLFSKLKNAYKAYLAA